MLRLGLIESVRRMALRTVQRLDEIEAADAWAARIQSANEVSNALLGEALRDFIDRERPLTPTFVSRFLQQLRRSAGAFPPPIWLEQWLAEEGLSADDAAARATQRLALTQLVMANSITSLAGHWATRLACLRGTARAASRPCCSKTRRGCMGRWRSPRR